MHSRPTRTKWPIAWLGAVVTCISAWNAAPAPVCAQAPDVPERTAKAPGTHEQSAAARESAKMRDARETAQARSLYEEGVAAAESADWDLAADRFRRAQSLRPSAATAFNLAAALEHVGKLVEAGELLRSVLRVPDCPVAVENAAQTLLSDIEPRLAALTIHLVGMRDGVVVDLDGTELKPSQLDVNIPVDPGQHEILVRQGDERLVEESVRTSEGASREVTLAVPEPPPAPELSVDMSAAAPTVSYAAPLDRASNDGSIVTTWWFWTAIGVVAAGTAVTVLVVSNHDDGPDPVSGDFEPRLLEIGL